MGQTVHISPATIETAWTQVGSLSDAHGRKLFDQLVKSQPELFGFIIGTTADLSEDAHGLALYLALVIYRAYDLEFPRSLSAASETQVSGTFHRNEQWLQRLEETHERIRNERVLPNLAAAQPAVYAYLLEALFDPDDEDVAVDEDEQGFLFLVLKTFIDVLDTCAQAKPRRKPARRRNPKVYRLKISLKGIRPPIWRRLVVNDMTLDELHNVIQVAMGWTDSHLHEFRAGGKRYAIPDPEWDDFGDVKTVDERKTRISKLLQKKGDKLAYTYDFGDSWEHVIAVEEVLPAAERVAHPVCLTGRRACPPEDCGGTWGYSDLLKALDDPEHPEHEELLEWLSEDFEPNAIYLDEINDNLERLDLA